MTYRHPARKDWTGVVVGRLTVVREMEERYHTSRFWECRCECGRMTSRHTAALTQLLRGGYDARCAVCLDLPRRPAQKPVKKKKLSAKAQVLARPAAPKDPVRLRARQPVSASFEVKMRRPKRGSREEQAQVKHG